MNKDKKPELMVSNPFPGITELDVLPTERATVNGDGPPATSVKKPSVRQSRSSPIQAMALIEKEMKELTADERAEVNNWFAQRYLGMKMVPQGQQP